MSHTSPGDPPHVYILPLDDVIKAEGIHLNAQTVIKLMEMAPPDELDQSMLEELGELLSGMFKNLHSITRRRR